MKGVTRTGGRRDMFTTLIGADSELSNVIKMHYLKSNVSGEAANLISNF